MVAYMERELAAHGTPWPNIARCMLGLYHGQRGARKWRQVWSNHLLKAEPARAVWQLAQAALQDSAPESENAPKSAPDCAPETP